MISHEFAARFAEEWVAVWNSRDLDRILSHYADDFEMASPYIAKVAEEPSGVLKGKAAVASYWSKALARLPSLHFELHTILVGADSLVLYYKGVSGMVAELFYFDSSGRVSKSSAHYEMNKNGISLPSSP
ncbi:MAG: nuclear transport factor 2 family protein [Nitrospira sp.]